MRTVFYGQTIKNSFPRRLYDMTLLAREGEYSLIKGLIMPFLNF
jgi:hypothetical protein